MAEKVLEELLTASGLSACQVTSRDIYHFATLTGRIGADESTQQQSHGNWVLMNDDIKEVLYAIATHRASQFK